MNYTPVAVVAPHSPSISHENTCYAVDSNNLLLYVSVRKRGYRWYSISSLGTIPSRISVTTNSDFMLNSIKYNPS